MFGGPRRTFLCPALAALRKLAARGKIDRDAVVVAILTGHALKDTDFIIKSQQRFEHALQGEAQL